MSKRFKPETAAEIILEVLEQDSEALIVPQSDFSLFDGCTDPSHCQQHPGGMVEIRTTLSATRLHKIASDVFFAARDERDRAKGPGTDVCLYCGTDTTGRRIGWDCYWCSGN